MTPPPPAVEILLLAQQVREDPHAPGTGLVGARLEALLLAEPAIAGALLGDPEPLVVEHAFRALRGAGYPDEVRRVIDSRLASAGEGPRAGLRAEACRYVLATATSEGRSLVERLLLDAHDDVALLALTAVCVLPGPTPFARLVMSWEKRDDHFRSAVARELLSRGISCPVDAADVRHPLAALLAPGSVWTAIRPRFLPADPEAPRTVSLVSLILLALPDGPEREEAVEAVLAFLAPGVPAGMQLDAIRALRCSRSTRASRGLLERLDTLSATARELALDAIAIIGRDVPRHAQSHVGDLTVAVPWSTR